MALEPLFEPDAASQHYSSNTSSPNRRRNRRQQVHVSKRSPNAQVLSSLIASLDGGEQSPITHASYTYVSSRDDDSGTHSPFDHASSRPAPPRLKHSQSFGMDYGAYRSPKDDQDYDSDGADFPVIRTARPPSGRSPHTAPASPSLSSIRDMLRSASKSSLMLNGQTTLSRSSSRLSAESWVRAHTSPSKLSLDAATEKFSRRLSLSLRQPSRETLKSQQQTADQALLGPALTLEPKGPSPTAKTDRGRLYLEDVIEDVHSPKPNTSTAAKPEASSSRSSPRKNSTAVPAPIPPRTSSLNRTPSPSRSRPRKLSKGKRAMATLKEERFRRKPKPEAPKDTFEGLDEQDETVKRIKELRRQKEDRLRKESEALGNLDDYQRSRRHVHGPAKLAVDRQDLSRAPDLRKAHRMLGLDDSASTVHHNTPVTVPPLSTDIYSQPSVSSSQPKRDGVLVAPPVNHLSYTLPPDSPILGNAFFTPQRPHSSSRPQTSYETGEIPQDSPSIGRRAVARKSTHSHLLNGLDIEGLDLSPPSTAHSNSTFQSRDRTTPTRRSSSDTKARRKSMSDAREHRLLQDDVLRDRRNSVSAAVNTYLDNPRLSQRVCHPLTGRVISFSEVGDPQGAAVVVCVGMGLTRFVSAFYDDLAASLGLRLITPERPGVGASEALRERDNIGPLGWSDDVLTITQHLGISQFSLIAHSAGAIYALATALILPQSVRGRVQLLAPWIPPSQFENINQKDRSPDNIPVASLTRGQRFLRVLPVPFLRAANGGFFSPASLKPTSSTRNNGSSSPVSESPRVVPKRRNSKKRPDPLRRESMILMDQVIPDRPRDTMFPLPELCEEERTGIVRLRKPSLELSATASPTDPAFTLAAEALNAAEHSARAHQAAYSTLLTERTWTLATRDSNPAVDLIVCLERHRDVGFRYVDVQRQVVITHGSEDKRVPVENIRWIGDQMNRCNAMHCNMKEKGELAGGGGCEIRILPGEGHGLMANPGVMADILAEISGEWVSTRW